MSLEVSHFSVLSSLFARFPGVLPAPPGCWTGQGKPSSAEGLPARGCLCPDTPPLAHQGASCYSLGSPRASLKHLVQQNGLKVKKKWSLEEGALGLQLCRQRCGWNWAPTGCTVLPAGKVPADLCFCGVNLGVSQTFPQT